ncbi:MAG TPA: hypothetical protein ENK48_05175 [Gammaproteobacteria bacterium]|nr:hypothetical protein [Gammaproteobacteria bacterium]
MTVASRPVLARHCTVSGTLSGNLSNPDDTHYCAGFTPDYWRDNATLWPPPYYPGDCQVVQGTGSCSGYVNGTPFHASYVNGAGMRGAFGGDLYGNRSMMDVLRLSASEDPTGLGAEAVAALLNAAHFGAETFGYTTEQVIDMWNARYNVDPEGLKEDFHLLNERDHW